MESVSTIRKTKLFNTKQSEQSYTKQEELEDRSQRGAASYFSKLSNN